MKCASCNSPDIEPLSKPEPIPDMPKGVFWAKCECLKCGLTLPMIFNENEIREIESKLGGAHGDGVYRLNLALMGLPKRINQAPGAHWYSRYGESLKWHKRLLGRMITQRLSPPPIPLQKAEITFIRYSSVPPDYDGLVQSFKPVMDALKKCLIIADDSMKVVGKPEYRWEKAKRKQGKIEIQIREVQQQTPLK